MAEIKDLAVAIDMPHFDIRRFGAVVDGTTDDTAAVEAAFATAIAAKGGVVHFPRGITRLRSNGTEKLADDLGPTLIIQGAGSASRVRFSDLTAPSAFW